MSNDILLGLLGMFIGVILLTGSISVLRLLWAHRKAEKYIRIRGITSGLYVKHGMVITKDGQVKPTSSPSFYAIRRFWK